MKCQVEGCEHGAVTESHDGNLALCQECADAGIELPDYADTPPEPKQCECDACMDRRRKACAAYQTMNCLRVAA